MNQKHSLSQQEILHNSVNPVSKSGSDLTGHVIGLAMKVHRALGPGFLESVYQKALLFELTRSGLSVCSDHSIQVRYEGVIVGDFKADLVVNDELIVELKAISTILQEHEIQVVNYLVATGKDIGLLINFGSTSLQFKKKYRKPKPIEEMDFR